jgi:hypothetical protein
MKLKILTISRHQTNAKMVPTIRIGGARVEQNSIGDGVNSFESDRDVPVILVASLHSVMAFRFFLYCTSQSSRAEGGGERPFICAFRTVSQAARGTLSEGFLGDRTRRVNPEGSRKLP